VRAALVWLALAAPAPAQEMVARLVADLDGDGREETAVLHDTDRIALEILDGDGRLAASSPEIVWRGPPNEGPDLATNAAGSLVVRSANWGIGRGKWEMAVTVAFRQGRFVVAGLTVEMVDTLVPGSDMRCDLNLLTGRGVIERAGRAREVRLAERAPPVEAWDERAILRLCPG
jgi:hypothetical protein